MISQGHVLQSTTQKYLEIFDITNDVLILQDGSVSMVLTSTAINFDLYSEEEQDAAIYAYAALLNSLSFSIEIVVRSQKKDVSSYLDLLKDQEVRAFNPVNKRNIKEYRSFVEQLVQERNVLEKKFYIIITYTALEAGILSGSSLIPGMSKKNSQVLDKHAILEKAITNLEPRRDHLVHQFARIGLFVKQLHTQDLIQLFYTIYNPESAKGVKLGDGQEYTSPMIQADIRPPELVTPAPHQEVQIEKQSEVVQKSPDSPVMVQPAVPTTPVPTPMPQVSPSPQLPAASSISPEPERTHTLQTQQSTPTVSPIQPEVPASQTTQPQSSGGSSAIKEDTFTITTDLQPPSPPPTIATPQQSGQTPTGASQQ